MRPCATAMLFSDNVRLGSCPASTGFPARREKMHAATRGDCPRPGRASPLPINSTLAPDESGADHEVPDCADHCPTETRDPPHAIVVVDPGGDTYVGDRADGANHLKADEPGHKTPPGQPLIAISEQVVEHEIPGDSPDGGERLCSAEGNRRGQDDAQYAEMNTDAGKSDQTEHKKPRGDGAVGELRCQQRREIQCDLAVELALAVLAFAECRRQLDNAQPAARRRQDIEQDLEALRGDCRSDAFEGIAPDHEMAAHRISEIDPEQQAY
jgi:hypothetical protein